jgi:L-aminopeptidase/D-esterase-like protein
MAHEDSASAGSICDVPGITVGHAGDQRGLTGCTVILCPSGTVGGVDVRGAAPGTRETDLLRPECTVEHVDAVLLSGGSAFGLDAAAGVMGYLEERGRGFAVRTGVVPIVPAAVIFDLGVGDPRARPDAAMGRAACEAAATTAPREGSVGAGIGATIGKLRGAEHAVRGGVGTASAWVGEVVVGALVVVNAVGEVVDERGQAWYRSQAGDDAAPDRLVAPGQHLLGNWLELGASTTIGVVATSLPLDKAGATRLAQAAHDGVARAVRPAHTAFDGDTFFALSAGAGGAPVWPVPVAISVAAADVVALAIRRAIRLANDQTGGSGAGEESAGQRR